MKKQGLFGLLALLAALSCDNGIDLASDESGGGTKAGAGGTKASGGTSAGKDGGGEQSGSGSAGLAGAQTGGSSGHGGAGGQGGASAGAGGADEPPRCPADLSSAIGQDCSAYDEGTQCSDGQTDPCQFGNSIICSTGKWQRRETFPAPCGGAGGGGGSSNGMLGEVCEPDENSCGQGLACCYPCGVEGCDFVCEARCAAGSAGCIDGCVARP